MSVVDKLIKYVKYETTSDENSVTVPSTEGQRVLVEELKRELEALGLETALDDNGYLFGFLRNNTGKNLKKLGLLAHVDTSPDMSGKNVNPRILAYEGGDIVLNEELQIVMKESDFPQLKGYVGENLLLTDGTTLLGADDKAGVAEIMEVLEYLFHNPEVPHEIFMWHSHRMKRLAEVHIILMWMPLARRLPIPWMVGLWASWSMRTSTRLQPR